MSCMIETVKELKKYLNDEECYLFGAGVVGKAALTWMRREGVQIKSIVVSKRGTDTEVLGFPIKELSEVTDIRERLIIVALMEKNHAEIETALQENHAERVLYISDVLYSQLECENGNFDTIIIHLLNWIKRKLQEEDRKREKEYRNLYTILFKFYGDRARYRWANKGEKKITGANWGTYYEREDFARRFQDLIRGLDRESIETVTRIVNRHKLYLSTEADEMDLFTMEEKKELALLQDNFYALIIELSPNLYMYRGYFLTQNVFGVSVFFYKHGVHKLHDLKKLEGGVFFDVGGYIGDSAIVLQELHPAKIYSFEALPQHCEEMKRNFKLNDVDNVVVENMVLGDKEKIITMDICGSGSNFVHRGGFTSEGTIDVQMRTLDDYMQGHNITECSLIKVDIEGSEPYFLNGAYQTISTYKPTLLLSIYHNEHDFFELKPLIESWNLGYQFQIYKPTNGNLTNETLLIAEVNNEV